MSAGVLGPDVVGRRVVVRRRLPSGSATDVLGVCTAWEADFLVVLPASGLPVQIAFSDVIAGKPVPPPPTRRPASPE